jgi:nucleoside-diphosphate-sugar epimerase
MRVLVTGAGGFVGSALCRALVQAQHQVHALTRDPERTARRIGLPVSMFAGSIGHPQEIARAAKGCEVIFHAAGLPPGPAPARVLRWLHIAGSENVLRAARHEKVARIVHFSASEVSLTQEDRMHWDEKRVLPSAPVGLFAETKLMAEELMLSHSDDSLEVVALRPARVWGPGDVDGVARLAQAAQAGTFRLYNGGRNIVATTYIDNLLRAALSAAEAVNAPAHAYYVTDGEFMEARELFGRLLATLELGPAKSGNYALAWLDASLKEKLGDGGAAMLELLRTGKSALFDLSAAVQDLQYEPRGTFDEKLAALAAWVEAQGGLAQVIAQKRPEASAADVDAQVQAAGGD